MFLRVVHSSIETDKIDEVLALKESTSSPRPRGSPGSVSFQGAVSRATGAVHHRQHLGDRGCREALFCGRSWATSWTGSPPPASR